MPRIYHRTDQAAANHSVYQTNASVDNSGILKEIATNTKNINLNVDTVEVSVDALEVLQAANNASTASLDTRLDNSIGAVNNSGNLGDGSNQLRAISLGYDRTGGKARSILVDSGGISQVHDSVVEASLTSLEGKIDTLDTVQDSALTKLNEIATNTANINVNVGDVEVNTNDLEILQASTNTKLDSIISKNGEIETSLNSILAKNGEIETTANAIQSAVEGTLTVGSHAVTNAGTFAVQAAVSGTVTANLSATDNAVLDAIAADGDAIQTKLDTLETSANAIQAAVEGTLTVGSHAVTNAGTFAVQAACSGTVTANLSATDNAVLDAIAADGDAIQTKQDTIIGHIDGIEALIGTTNTNTAACATDLAALEVLLTAANVDHAANEVLLTAVAGLITTSNNGISSINSGISDLDSLLTDIEGGVLTDNKDLLTTIDSDTDNIKTATELVATAVDTNSSNATAVRSDVYFEGVASETNSGNKNANCQRVVLATDDVNSAAINTATSACATDLAALEVLSTAANVDLAAMEVLLTAANVDHAANEVLLTAISADGDAVQTKLDHISDNLDTLETTLTEIAPRTTTGTLSAAANLADGAATAIVDTNGYRYMTFFGKATNSFELTVQYSLTNSASNMVSVYLQDMSSESVNDIETINRVLEHPARYVRFINFNGDQATALTLYYQLSN